MDFFYAVVGNRPPANPCIQRLGCFVLLVASLLTGPHLYSPLAMLASYGLGNPPIQTFSMILFYHFFLCRQTYTYFLGPPWHMS